VLAATICASHGAAITAALVSLPVPAAAIVAAGLALSAIEHVRLALHRTPRAVVGLEFAADGSLAVAGPADDWSPATLRSAAVPVPWLTVVTLRDAQQRRRSVVILPDAVESEAFRRLRVWLRWRSPARGRRAGGE